MIEEEVRQHHAYMNCIHMSTYDLARLQFNMVRQRTRDFDNFACDPCIVGSS